MLLQLKFQNQSKAATPALTNIGERSLNLGVLYKYCLTKSQKKIIRKQIPEIFRRKLKYSPFRIIESILYVVKTGCQWYMLPLNFPKWRCVYNHFRRWSDKGWFLRLMHILVRRRRAQQQRNPSASVAVIDSQSVRWGTIDSVKGIDGFRKVKGIKRHIAVDSQGNPLEIHVTAANVHDSKAAYTLISATIANHDKIKKIKADKGYNGSLGMLLPLYMGIELECVKSNFGTSDFIPFKGRWVVERTFSWLESYRRMNRNYEKRLDVARHMAVCACIAMMLKFF